MDPQRRALRTAARNLGLNGLLAAVKLTVGSFACSEALISDGVHGVADVFSEAVVMVGIRVSATKKDQKHPYGYERMECVAAVVLAMLIGIAGVTIGLSGVQMVLSPQKGGTLGAVAFVAAAVSVAVKELMFRLTRREAIRTRSSALMADAWHQRTDVFASLGGLLGTGGACVGWTALDPLAACVISVLIVRAAVMIFADAIRKMIDRACDEATECRICQVAETTDGVLSAKALRTRLFGNRVVAEVTVCVDETLAASAAYRVACAVAQAVETAVPIVKECVVRIHPIAVANSSQACYNKS